MAWSRIISATLLFCCTSLLGADTKYIQTKFGKTAYKSMDNKTKTVVFQAGLGDDSSTYKELLKKSNNSFSYVAIDRLGKGGSSKPANGRSSCDIAKEQREALINAGFKPPFILIGHSLGGLYQYVYAKMYPSDVEAMILLDPTHPKHWESLQKTSSSLALVVKTLRLMAFSAEDKREFDAQTECLDRLDIDTPLKTPTTFLFSGSFSPLEKGLFEEMMALLRADWMRLVEGANAKTIHSSGHYLQNEASGDVLGAISESLGK